MTAETTRDKLETLYLESCEYTGHEPSQAGFERWASRAEKLMRRAIGMTVKIDVTRRERRNGGGAARRVIVTGTIKAVQPAGLHYTGSGTTLAWQVELTSGRSFTLHRLPQG